MGFAELKPDIMSDDAIRDVIARTIWAYHERHIHFAPYDDVLARDVAARGLLKRMAIDEAESIRAALFCPPRSLEIRGS